MVPKVVSSKTFYLCTAFFYSLCLSGLVWQVWQISDNYLKFDVIKDIKVFTPEESSRKEKAVYICFSNRRIIDETTLQQLVSKYKKHYSRLPLRERFKVTYKSYETFSGVKANFVDELIIWHNFEHKYCYKFSKFRFVFLNLEMLQNRVSYFEVAIENVKYPFDKKRLVRTEVKWINSTQRFDIVSKSYKITKLQSPYSDHCFDYTTIGLMDQNDAISTCNSNKTHLHGNKVVLKSIFISSNSSLWGEGFDKCKKQKLDCNTFMYITKVSVGTQLSSQPSIWLGSDLDASFDVISKERINDIDYITYILGALGTWIGFSFIGINPIPYLIRKQDNGITDTINHDLNSSSADIVTKQDLVRLRLQTIRINQISDEKSNEQLQTLQQEIDELTQSHNELIQSSNQKTDELKQNVQLSNQKIDELKQSSNQKFEELKQTTQLSNQKIEQLSLNVNRVLQYVRQRR